LFGAGSSRRSAAASTAADFAPSMVKPAYAIGEKIAPLHAAGPERLRIVTGGDDGHLDFRGVVAMLVDGDASRVRDCPPR
jgi:hypothetical protein